MKLHIQHRLAEACISWGDYLRLGAVSFLQLQQESYACTLEAQPEYLLLYVKEGTMYLVRNRVEAMYSAGSLLLLPPEEEYRLHFAREKQASAYWLSFSGFSITKLLVDSGLMNQPVFHTPPDCDLSYLFEGILRQSLPSPADPRTVSLNSMGLFMQLLAAIVPYTKPAQPKPTPEKIIECECTTKALAYAVHLIQDDIAAPLDVEELARSLQMSTSHFIRTFKTQVGYSPLAYQTRLRIERAKDLLQATDLRVSEIAQRIGYQNPMYFSSTFKKHTGMTPLEYREKSSLAS